MVRLARLDAEDALRRVSPDASSDASSGTDLLDRLLTEGVLVENEGHVEIHPDYREWKPAANVSERLHVSRVDLVGEGLPAQVQPTEAVFVGPQGNRRLIVADAAQSGYLSVADSSTSSLRSVMEYLLGEPGEDDDAPWQGVDFSRQAEAWAATAATFLEADVSSEASEGS